MNLMTIDGRIGANGAEVRMTKGGTPYVKFSVANNTFSNGTEKTEWYDVISYEPSVIENRVKYLTKGTFVIINGVYSDDINIDKNGKVWLNRHIRATVINVPTLGKKSDDSATATVINSSDESLSTYTASTLSSTVIPKPEPVPAVATVGANSIPSVSEVSAGVMDVEIDDDLPF